MNSDASHQRLAAIYPNAQIPKADLAQSNDCRIILSGASMVYHIGPSFHPRESSIGFNMIDAALAEIKRPQSVFKHFIYSSVLTSQISKLLNHDCKRVIEEALIESSLNYTILQPSHFVDPSMDRILAIRGDEPLVYKAWFNPDVKFSFLALEDLGEVSKKVIEEGSSHYFAIYQVVSTMPKSYTDLLKEVSGVLGKEVKVEQLPYTDIVGQVTKMMLGTDATQAAKDGPERLILYYNSRGILGNPSVTEMLLGRKATDTKELFQRKFEEIRK